MKTQTLLIVGGIAVLGFLYLQSQSSGAASSAPQTGAAVAFNPDGSLASASIGLDGLFSFLG